MPRVLAAIAGIPRASLPTASHPHAAAHPQEEEDPPGMADETNPGGALLAGGADEGDREAALVHGLALSLIHI